MLFQANGAIKKRKWKWRKFVDKLWKKTEPPDWTKVVLLWDFWKHWIGKKSQKICGVIVGSSVFDSLLTVGHWVSRQVHFRFNCFSTNPTECSTNFTNSIVQFKECACALIVRNILYAIWKPFPNPQSVSLLSKWYSPFLNISMKPWIFYTWIHKDNARFTCLHAFPSTSCNNNHRSSSYAALAAKAHEWHQIRNILYKSPIQFTFIEFSVLE